MSRIKLKHFDMNNVRLEQEFVRLAVKPKRRFRRAWLKLFVLGRFVPDTPVDRDMRAQLPHSKETHYLQATRKRITPAPKRR